MHNEFTAIIEQDGEWFIAFCPEIPGANGQGKTSEDARNSLAEAIALILEDRREDAPGFHIARPRPPMAAVLRTFDDSLHDLIDRQVGGVDDGV